MIQNIKNIYLVSLLIIISIVGLMACDFTIGNIAFGNTVSADEITLATNDVKLRGYQVFGDISVSGSYDLLKVETKSGFEASFSITDNDFIASNTVIIMNGIFFNEMLEKYKDIDENDMASGWAAVGEIIENVCDVYIDNKLVSKRMLSVYVDYDANIFDNTLTFKDKSGKTYKLKLPEKYKDIIYKKMQIYINKRNQKYAELEKEAEKQKEFYENWGNW